MRAGEPALPQKVSRFPCYPCRLTACSRDFSLTKFKTRLALVSLAESDNTPLKASTKLITFWSLIEKLLSRLLVLQEPAPRTACQLQSRKAPGQRTSRPISHYISSTGAGESLLSKTHILGFVGGFKIAPSDVPSRSTQDSLKFAL